MIIKTLTRSQAKEKMEELRNNQFRLPEIDEDLLPVREAIQSISDQVDNELKNPSLSIKKKDYYIDYRTGLLLYQYLDTQKEFTMRVASNDDFWRYLSIMIVPDVVEKRWGRDSDERYWSNGVRIWLRSIWWYVHLSWQGSPEKTEKLLKTRHFTTDTILNFVERPGRKGTYIEVYRKILAYYSKIPDNKRLAQKSTDKTGKQYDLFRTIMKLNTVRILVSDPELCDGGIDGYVRSLFRDVGVNLDASKGN